MNLTALFAAVLAFQAAGQTPPPPQQQPVPPAVPAPKVPTTLPDKYFAPPPGPGSAVAKVDGEVVYGHDVENLLWEYFGPQAIEEVTTLVLVRQAAAKEGVTVTQAEVEKEVKNLMAKSDAATAGNPQSGRPKDQPIEDFLASRGYPLSRLYLTTEVQVTLDKLSSKSFDPKHYVKVSLILYKSADATPAAVKAAQDKADAAVKQLKAGTKWETIVKNSDLPPQYVNLNGLLGWLDESSFPQDVVSQIKDLQPGQTTPAIKVVAGPNQGNITSFQIFRVEQLGAKAVGADLDEFKSKYLENQRKPLLEKLKDAAKVETFPTKEPAQSAAPKAPAGGTAAGSAKPKS